MKAYIDWIVEQALPVWSTWGFDSAGGRFRERLDHRGAPVPVPHRAMVQARQIYVFAHAARLGWFPAGGALAEAAMAGLMRDFRADADGCTSFHFSIDPASGAAVSIVRDAYAHAFVLFSIAALYGLNGDAGLLDVADRTVRFIDTTLADSTHGGLFDAVPAQTRDKRQNPHMHLLEAYLFLERAAPGRGYIERAAGLVALFDRHMFKADRAALLEYFEADWSPHADPVRGTVFEPGHHFEWVWLLEEYGRASGVDVTRWIGPLFDTAAAHGLAGTGLVFDELAADDRRVLKRSHRVWPHTEAIKAAVARSRSGDVDAAALADRMAKVLLARFLDRPFAGGWIDHIDVDGAPLVDYVPASSLYHLFLAAAEADTTFNVEPHRAVESVHG